MNYPSDPTIERSVLACGMIEDPAALQNIRSVLTEADFTVDANRRIFRSLCRLQDAGRAVTVVEVFSDCRAHHEEVELGYLVDVDAAPYVLDRYLVRLRELSARRRLMLAGQQLTMSAADLTAPLEDLAQRAAADIAEAAHDPAGRESPEDVGAIIEAAGGINEFLKPHPGIPSPWDEFNRATGGFQRGDLILIGARPSMGKTAISLNAFLHAVRNGVPSAFYSFEMSRDSILRRLLCLVTGLSYQQLMAGDLDRQTRQAVAEATAWLKSLPLRIIGASGKTALAVRVHAERLHRRGLCEYAVVDYIGIVKATGEVEGRTRQLGDICRQLKETAMVLQVPFVVLAQLNRATATRDDKRPGLPDLRDSGELEEHADLVAFLHRPGYYNRNEPNLARVAELIIAKQRNGDTPIINLEFNGRCGRFENPAAYAERERYGS